VAFAGSSLRCSLAALSWNAPVELFQLRFVHGIERTAIVAAAVCEKLLVAKMET
jgi:hypothetical protein